MRHTLPFFVDRACAQHFGQDLRTFAYDAVDVAQLPYASFQQGAVLLLRIGARYNDGALKAIRTLRAQNRFAVVLGILPWDEFTQISLPKFVRAGIDEVITCSLDTGLRGSLDRISARLSTPPPRQELQYLHLQFPKSFALSAVSYGIRNGSAHLTANVLARCFGCAARTLRENLAGAGFPCPRDVCRCGWFLNYAELRPHSAQSAEHIARQIGFSDATDLRKSKSQLRRSVERDIRLASFVSTFPRLVHVLKSFRTHNKIKEDRSLSELHPLP